MSIQKNIVLVLMGVIIGILLCQLFHSTTKVITPNVSNTNNQIAKVIQQTELLYTQKEEVLATNNNKLNANLKSNNKQLVQLQKRNIQLQTQVANIISNKQTDTSLLLQTCDSLQQKVKQLILVDNQKDSIYNEVMNDLTELSSKKDSLIILQKEQAAFLKNKAQQCLENNNALNSQLLTFQKENKKQSKRRLVKIGAGFITAIFLVSKVLK